MPAHLRPASIARFVAAAALVSVLVPSVLAAAPSAGLGPAGVPSQNIATEPAATSGPPRMVSGWIPDWADATETATLTSNGDLLDVASPFWYGANDVTKITGYKGAGDSRVVRALQQRGALVMPTIEDDMEPARLSRIMNSRKERARHVHALTALTVKGRFDGLDLDYEVMAGADPTLRPSLRAGFSLLVADLARSLHQRGLKLSVTVLPKQTDDLNVRASVHDYKVIGKHADRVRVMAYDYSYPGGPSGPVAPLPWVNRVLVHATSVIDRSKVQVGIPLYGYDWSGPSQAATRISQKDALVLLKRTGAVRQWDAGRGSSHFSYTDDADVRHEVWYPDPQAVAAKVDLVSKHRLAGASFFAFGHEDAYFWPAMRSWAKSVQPVPAPAATESRAGGARL